MGSLVRGRLRRRRVPSAGKGQEPSTGVARAEQDKQLERTHVGIACLACGIGKGWRDGDGRKVDPALNLLRVLPNPLR